MTKTLNEINRLFGEGTVAGVSDGQLLERFASRGDDAAFAAIVARHGGMVLAVCRSALGPRDGADAEDALQATFIVLARRAGSFPVQGSLAGWLYRVARRVARRARIEATRRRGRERIATSRREAEAPHDPSGDEIRGLIHQELASLPERYRMPIVLCDLHGLTRDEAAATIGCPPGTVAGRLARAREKLRDRLIRRGVTSPSALPMILNAAIDDRSRLFEIVARAALAAARGDVVATAAGRLAVAASGVLVATRLPAILAISTALIASGALVAFLAFRPNEGPAVGPVPIPPVAVAVAPIPQGPVEAAKPIDPDDPAVADLFGGRVVDLAGKPIAGARLYLVPSEPLPARPGEVRAISAIDGRFRFSAKDMTTPSLDGLPVRRPGLLIATAEGHGPDFVQTWGPTGSSFRSHTDPIKTAEWTMTLPHDDVPIRGRLLGPGGRPLVGATVTLAGLSVPRGKDLDAHLERIKRPLGLFGSYDYDRSINAPRLLPGVTHGDVTDAEGRFRLAGLGRDRIVALAIRGPGIVDLAIDVMTREAPAAQPGPEGPAAESGVRIEPANFTITPQPGRTVRVLVRDRATGLPLPNVWVGMRMNSITGLESGRYPDATDAQGRFAINGISPDLAEMDVLAVPKPGLPYFLARAAVNAVGEAVVDCLGGIPFRLTLRDEAGRPVNAGAEVTYSAIQPNENFHKLIGPIMVQAGTPLSRAARQADGSYLGVALPGPGAITVKMPPGVAYRPAHVDPKAFFAPGKTGWTSQELITTYGNHDTLSVATFYGGAWLNQHDYAAIVLVNPPEGGKLMELTSSIARDRPRKVSLIDPEGRPVSGVKTKGMTYHPWDDEGLLRSSRFSLTALHPDRGRRILFMQDDRKLIGFLVARGDGELPYVVQMQPWATLTGRFVDDQGRPLGFDSSQPLPGGNPSKVSLAAGTRREFAAHDDPELGLIPDVEADKQGRFRVEKLVPGLVYSADYYVRSSPLNGTAFEGIKLAPGEVRDLGNIWIKRPAEPQPLPRPVVTPPAG